MLTGIATGELEPEIASGVSKRYVNEDFQVAIFRNGEAKVKSRKYSSDVLHNKVIKEYIPNNIW